MIKILLTVALTLIAAAAMLYAAHKVHKRAYGIGFQVGSDWTVNRFEEICSRGSEVRLNDKTYFCERGTTF